MTDVSQTWFIGLKDHDPRYIDKEPLQFRNWTWLDGSDITNATLWYNGSDTVPPQPNKGSAECGVIASNFGFLIGDRNCDKPVRYICEKPLTGNFQ